MKKVRLIVADDDLDDHMLIRDAIREAEIDCQIISVYNGLQLMDYLQNEQGYTNSEKPDGVLLDLNMPLLNGFEVLQKIRSNPDFKDLPVYVLSTSKAEYDMNRAKEYGATGYYSKSMVFGELQDLLKRLCTEIKANQ